MVEDDTEVEQELERAAQNLAAAQGIVSQEEGKEYFEIVKDLPVPDFSVWAEQERKGNTERYILARTQSRVSVGLAPGRAGSRHVSGRQHDSDTERERFQQFPRFASLHKPSTVLQRWEGYVMDVLDDTFTARLVPIDGEGEDQEAEIYLDEISHGDRELVEPGALFEWTIGYVDGRNGRCRTSLIQFSSQQAWKKSDLKHADAEARRLASLFADD